jgi:hypothetical protein
MATRARRNQENGEYAGEGDAAAAGRSSHTPPSLSP